MATGLIEQPSSRSKIGSTGMEFVYKCNRGQGSIYFSQFARMAEAEMFHEGMYIDLDSCRMSPGEVYDTLFIVGSTMPKYAGYTKIDRANGDTTYNLSITYMDRPIGMMFGYVTMMDYDLYAAIEATDAAFAAPPEHYSTVPLWALIATDINVPIEDQLKYRWAQSQPPDQTVQIGGVSKTYRWVIIMPRALPGVSVKTIACPTVIERIYFKSEARANQALKRGNTLLAPKKTYIYGKENKNWLFQPQGVEEIDNYFVCVNHYIYADKWSTLLYDEAT